VKALKFLLLAAGLALAFATVCGAQPLVPALPAPGAPAAAAPFHLNIGLEGGDKPGDVSVAVQIVVVMTLLSLAPSLVIMMTSFTRIVIVLGFVRTAIGVPSAPSNQILVGLSLFLTLVLMGPVFDRASPPPATRLKKRRCRCAISCSGKPGRETWNSSSSSGAFLPPRSRTSPCAS
jgi:flagellar biosynthetic protein FliP